MFLFWFDVRVLCGSFFASLVLCVEHVVCVPCFICSVFCLSLRCGCVFVSTSVEFLKPLLSYVSVGVVIPTVLACVVEEGGRGGACDTAVWACCVPLY